LRKIDELRKNDNPLSGYDFIHLNHYSFFVEPTVAVEKLNEIYNSVKNTAGKFSKGSPRVLLAGHAVAIGDYVVPKMLEDAGALIAAEMLDDGIRWYKWDTATEGDMLRNIWRAKYLDKPPINIFQPAWRERFEYIKSLIKENRIDGVVWYQLSFDEIYDMEYTCLSNWLEEIKMPCLKLESSYEYSRGHRPINHKNRKFCRIIERREVIMEKTFMKNIWNWRLLRARNCSNSCLSG
jgi:benzoyl-CoA reductase/2-hydroxyglutaryl-CoA dehydratase subunit BcrC/BadD/HgdB